MPKQSGGGASGWEEEYYADFRVPSRPSDCKGQPGCCGRFGHRVVRDEAGTVGCDQTVKEHKYQETELEFILIGNDS